MGELQSVEPQFENLIDHLFAIGVAGVVPAGGKGQHWGERTELWLLLDDAVEGSGLPFGIYENGGQVDGLLFFRVVVKLMAVSPTGLLATVCHRSLGSRWWRPA